jgi:O-antigen/teichoic acid export membrane protein
VFSLKKITAAMSVRATGTLMGGTLVAQLFTVAISPILSRMYDAHDFGVFGMYIALSNIGLVIGTAKYETAIVSATDEREAFLLRRLCLLIAVTLSALLLLVLTLDRATGARLAGAASLASLVWLLPLALLLLAIFQVQTFSLIRAERFRSLAAMRTARSVVSGVAQLLMSAWPLAGAGLVVGQLLGQLAAVLGLSSARRSTQEHDASHTGVRREELLAVARANSRFPRFELPQGLLSTFSQQLPVFALTALFNAAAAGLYVMAYRVLVFPVQLVGQSTRQVLLQRVSAAVRARDPVLPILKSSMTVLAGAGIVPTIVLMVFAGDLFAFFLGAEWRQGGAYAAALAPWLAVVVLKETALGAAPALKLQGSALLFEIVGVVLRGAALLTGLAAGEVIHSVIAYSAVGTILNVVFVATILRAASRHDSETAAATAQAEVA